MTDSGNEELSNPYLLKRRSRLVQNDALLRSLGLIVSPSSKEKAQNRSDRETGVKKTVKSAKIEKEQRKQRQLERKKAALTLEKRRSTRKRIPRSTTFMEEDFSRETTYRKRLRANGGGKARIVSFPVDFTSDEITRSEIAALTCLEKGNVVAIIWEGLMKRTRKRKNYHHQESDDDDDNDDDSNDDSNDDDDDDVVDVSSSSRKILDLPNEIDFTVSLVSISSTEEANNHLYDMKEFVSISIQAIEIRRRRFCGVLRFVIPNWLPLGRYSLELGSESKGILCITDDFLVKESVGRLDETNVGVWCVCGNTDANEGEEYTGCWVSCTSCSSWQHWNCYMRISESRNTNGQQTSAEEEAKILEPLQEEKVEKSSSEEEEEEEEEEESVDNDDDEEDFATKMRRRKQRFFRIRFGQRKKEQMQMKKEIKKQTRSLANRVSKTHLLVPSVLPNPDETFLCWACQPLSHVNHPHILIYNHHQNQQPQAMKQDHLIALGDRVELMLNMITSTCGGYSRKFKDIPNQCVTPKHVVKFLKTLIDPTLELKCADLGSGSGAFSCALPDSSLCVEINEIRYLEGKKALPKMEWMNQDVLTPEFFRQRFCQYDLIISNPDFEVGLQFIFVALCMIRNHSISGESGYNSGRLIFLLPTDYFEASGLRSRIFKLLDFHIETEYKLGHLCYYENAPNSQKKTCDSLFILKPGRGRAKYEHRVVNARLAGML